MGLAVLSIPFTGMGSAENDLLQGKSVFSRLVSPSAAQDGHNTGGIGEAA